MELQIKEFGQTPKQLFKTPHPQRLVGVSVDHQLTHSEVEEVRTIGVTTHGLGRVESPMTSDPNDEGWVHVEVENGVIQVSTSTPSTPTSRSLRLGQALQAHKGPVHAVCLSHDGKNLFSVSHGKL